MPFASVTRVKAAASAAAVAMLVIVTGLRAQSAGPAAIVTRGPATCKAVALTFDLCPVTSGAGFDRELVTFLERNRIHATFFASGAWMTRHDAELRELLAQPFFEIGTHGQAHAHMKTQSLAAQREEIAGAVRLLADHAHRAPTLFRPPYGEYNADTLSAAGAEGQTVVMWSVVSGDPDPKLPAAAIEDDAVARARNGSVIIFHANGRGWKTKDTVPEVYRRLSARGLGLLTVSELTGGCRAGTED